VRLDAISKGGNWVRRDIFRTNIEGQSPAKAGNILEDYLLALVGFASSLLAIFRDMTDKTEPKILKRITPFGRIALYLAVMTGLLLVAKITNDDRDKRLANSTDQLLLRESLLEYTRPFDYLRAGYMVSTFRPKDNPNAEGPVPRGLYLKRLNKVAKGLADRKYFDWWSKVVKAHMDPSIPFEKSMLKEMAGELKASREKLRQTLAIASGSTNKVLWGQAALVLADPYVDLIISSGDMTNPLDMSRLIRQTDPETAKLIGNIDSYDEYCRFIEHLSDAFDTLDRISS
jgi:hypothetical protein